MNVKLTQLDAWIARFVANHRPCSSDAWIVVYKLLWWCDEIDDQYIPHLVETSSLREKSWKRRAQIAMEYLARNFGCPVQRVCHMMDQLVKGLNLQSRQRQNYLGYGFQFVLKHLIKQIVNIIPLTDVRVDVIHNFSALARRAPRRKVDLVLISPSDFRLLISAKWSLRHDRLRDLLQEAEFFKRYKETIKVFAVTNEFMLGRLRMLAESPWVDHVYHVHLPLLRMCHDNRPLDYMKDLTDLFTDIRRII